MSARGGAAGKMAAEGRLRCVGLRLAPAPALPLLLATLVLARAEQTEEHFKREHSLTKPYQGGGGAGLRTPPRENGGLGGGA